MASTLFSSGTVITSSWLNDVNSFVYNTMVDSIAALRQIDKTKTTRVLVTGYYSPGDGGGGVYCYIPSDTTSTDNMGSMIVANDGGRWMLSQVFPKSIKQFGAKGDGSTDDRVAIQSAIDSSIPGNTLYIPKTAQSFYSVSKGSGNYCLLITKSLNFIGDGLYSAINPDTSATSAVDTILLIPSSSYGFYGMTWENFTLGNPNNATRNGRHGIFVDTTGAGNILPKPIFSRLNIMQSNNGGNAFIHLNNATNNANGGMYGAEIVDCPILKGGISLQASGDSNIIHRNIISGSGLGIYASLVNGASLLTIQDNNITSDGGQIKIDAGSRFKILHNNMEQTVATTGQAVMVNIAAANGTVVMGEIRGNHMGAFTGSNMTANIYIGSNALSTLIVDNTLLNSNSGFSGPAISNAGSQTRIGYNDYGTNITSPVSDTGTGTMGIKKTLTLQNGWVALSGFPAPYYVKDLSGIVHIHGMLSSGTATMGTVISNLPQDYWPSATQEFATASYNGGSYVASAIGVNSTNGNITYQAGSNAQYGLQCSYRAANAGVINSNV